MSNSVRISLFQDTELQRYLNNISSIKMLTLEEENQLSLDVYNNKNKESAQKLIVSHLPLVVKIAYSYKGYGLPLLDIISEGNIGLIRAVAKFNPLKGNRLSTYAIFWIKAYISDYILNSWSLVKMGTISARKKLFFSLNKIKNKLGITNNNLTNSNIQEIAQASNVSKKDVIDINSMLTTRDLYLQSSIYKDQDDSITFEDTIENFDDNPEEIYQNKQSKDYINKMIKSAFEILDDREKAILLRRYVNQKAESLESIGESLKLSRERVRQIEKIALAKAKKFLLNNYKDIALSV